MIPWSISDTEDQREAAAFEPFICQIWSDHLRGLWSQIWVQIQTQLPCRRTMFNLKLTFPHLLKHWQQYHTSNRVSMFPFNFCKAKYVVHIKCPINRNSYDINSLALKSVLKSKCPEIGSSDSKVCLRWFPSCFQINKPYAGVWEALGNSWW